jgi:tRNA dimethylallyltransferase
MKPKLIVICGPTATGKSDLAVELALKFDGEVVSADSRQVYRGLDIGSGKITTDEMRGVPHHLLDVADPSEAFSVALYKKQADAAITDIVARGKVPILCGGTGLYVSAVVDNRVFPQVPPNEPLRAELEALPLTELQSRLQTLDPERFETIEQENPMRLIRAIEIATALGKVPPEPETESPYDVLMIGLILPDAELRERIEKRLESRLEIGMIDEVKTLHENGLSWQRLEALGLEYQYIAEYLQEKISYDEMKQFIVTKSWQYSKRQMTWFKRDKRIQWTNPKSNNAIYQLVSKSLSND